MNDLERARIINRFLKEPIELDGPEPSREEMRVLLEHAAKVEGWSDRFRDGLLRHYCGEATELLRELL